MFLRPYRVPLARPLATARATLTERRGFLLVLATADGRFGLGEAAPLPSHATEADAACEATLRAAAARVVGHAPAEARKELDALVPAFADAPAARCAYATALLDLDAQGAGHSVAARLAAEAGRKPAREVPVNALLAGPEEVAQAVADGYPALKLKAPAASTAEVLAAATREAAGRGPLLRLDANGGWAADEARAVLRALAAHGVDYVEQPVPADDLAGLAALRRVGGTRVAADESASRHDAARRVLVEGAADVLVLKPTTLGGPDVAVRLAAEAAARDVDVVVTTALETAVGRAAALAAAAALGPAVLPSGLDTGRWLARDVAPGPAVRRGRIAVPTALGLGVSLADPAGGERLA